MVDVDSDADETYVQIAVDLDSWPLLQRFRLQGFRHVDGWEFEDACVFAGLVPADNDKRRTD